MSGRINIFSTNFNSNDLVKYNGSGSAYIVVCNFLCYTKKNNILKHFPASTVLELCKGIEVNGNKARNWSVAGWLASSNLVSGRRGHLTGSNLVGWQK